MTLRELENKILKIIKEELKYINDDGGIEIYTDYTDRELSLSFIKDIIKHKNPYEVFNDMLAEWSMDYEAEYGINELEKEIKEYLTEEEIDLFNDNSAELWDFIHEYVYFYYDANDFNNDVKVNILIDCGNWNYDCTCDNVLNWYGNSGNGSIPIESSMLWLAKTQGKATALRKACKRVHRNDGYYNEREINEDKFIESCIQEFENASSSMNTVTFLVEMNLFDLFHLIELKQKEETKSYFVLGKDTECGLFDPWNGGGSVLEIELDKDIKVPIKNAIFTVDGCKQYGYDVDEVYGLIGSCWKETLKNIVEVK